MGFWSRVSAGLQQGVATGFEQGMQIGQENRRFNRQADLQNKLKIEGRQYDEQQKLRDLEAQRDGLKAKAEAELQNVDLATPEGRQAAQSSTASAELARVNAEIDSLKQKTAGGAGPSVNAGMNTAPQASAGAPAMPSAPVAPSIPSVTASPALPGIGPAAAPAASTGVAAPTGAPGLPPVGQNPVMPATSWQKVSQGARDIERALAALDPSSTDNTDALEKYRQSMLVNGVSEDKADSAVVKAQRGLQTMRDDFFRENFLNRDDVGADELETAALRYGVSANLSGIVAFRVKAKKLSEQRNTAQFGAAMAQAGRAEKDQAMQEAQMALGVAARVAPVDFVMAGITYDKAVLQLGKFDPQIAAGLARSKDAYLKGDQPATIEEAVKGLYELPLKSAEWQEQVYGALVALGKRKPVGPMEEVTVSAEDMNDLEKAYREKFASVAPAINVDVNAGKIAAYIMQGSRGAERERRISDVLAQLEENTDVGPAIKAELERLGVLGDAPGEQPQLPKPTPAIGSIPGQQNPLAAMLGQGGGQVAGAQAQTQAAPAAPAPAMQAAPVAKPLSPLSPMIGSGQNSDGIAAKDIDELMSAAANGRFSTMSAAGMDAARKQADKTYRAELARTGDNKIAKAAAARMLRLQQ
jgi:hypothetical protein